MKHRMLLSLILVFLLALTSCGSVGRVEKAVDPSAEAAAELSTPDELEMTSSEESVPAEEPSEEVSDGQSSEEARTSGSEEDGIFKNMADHCTFKFSPSFTITDAEYTMDDELLAAIYGLVPELNEYLEEYQDLLLKQMARDIVYDTTVYGSYETSEEVRASFEEGFRNYYDYGYADSYQEETEAEVRVSIPSGVTLDNFSASDYASKEEAAAVFGELVRQEMEKPAPDVENPEDYYDLPEVTVYCEEYGETKFIHTGEFEGGVAVYNPADENGNIIVRDDGIVRRFHITKDGQTIRLFDDMSRVEVSDGTGAKFTDHIRW